MTQKTRKVEAIPLENVQINGGLWYERQSTSREKTLPAIYRQLEATGRLKAWTLDSNRELPKHRQVVYMFWDSDTGKWLEAVGYSLKTHPDPALEKQADEVIQLIEKAQQPDGYLNTYFTVLAPESQWSNLRDWHEMYNAGHLIEGAIAYYQATGKRTILDVMMRNADLIDSLFGPKEGQKRGYPGHPELELALVKLYRETGEQRYLDLSKYFIDERGQEPNYFDIESRERGEDPEDFWAQTYRYCQAHKPLREQTEATGHAVRACYLYAGVADVALETDDQSLVDLSLLLWDDMTQHQMYITGGLGPARTNEGFTFVYDLPNETAYAETCAAISLAFWSQRMFRLDQDGRYIDVMERALYNTMLSGVSYDGEHFFYANPLASYPNVNPHEPFSGGVSDQYYRRENWFLCPCCPPNLARTVANIGTYFYSISADTIYAHLYNQSQAQVPINGTEIQIEQQTNYPWDGEIDFTINSAQPTEFDLALRIPGWCHDYQLTVNGDTISADAVKGYVHIRREWQSGDQISLSLNMPVERMVAHPHVREDAGQIALQRGPIVYCLEEADNGAHLANVVIPCNSEFEVTLDDNLFGGMSVITGSALRIEPESWSGDLYQPQSKTLLAQSSFTFKAIPYCFWANRQPGEMRVWVREV